MVNWNNALSYDTAKIVTIRDARLGLLHYGFMFVIVVYIGVFSILIQQHYLFTESPVGSIRLSLLKGKVPVPLIDMKYCYLPNRTTLPNGQQLFPCEYQDEKFVVFPETEADAMLATTRYTYMKETLNCSLLDDPSCSFQSIYSSTKYIADIEQFTMLIDHTLYAPTIGLQRNARTLKGSINHANGTKMSLSGNNVIGREGSPDIIQLQTLLLAAGITSLDSVSLVNTSSSLRYDGLILIIFITYSNMVSYNLNHITYTYRPSLITNTEFKSVQTTFGNETYREIYNRHGIRMIFIQDGLIGAFDFQVTLLTFVSGLGLLAMSTVIVDMIALQVLPQKNAYKEYKYKQADRAYSAPSPPSSSSLCFPFSLCCGKSSSSSSSSSSFASPFSSSLTEPMITEEQMETLYDMK